MQTTNHMRTGLWLQILRCNSSFVSRTLDKLNIFIYHFTRGQNTFYVHCFSGGLHGIRKTRCHTSISGPAIPFTLCPLSKCLSLHGHLTSFSLLFLTLLAAVKTTRKKCVNVCSFIYYLMPQKSFNHSVPN